MGTAEEICKELMKKTEWVAMVTWSEEGPHLVATWGDYVRSLSGDDGSVIVVPAGHYNKTETNLKKNKSIQLMIASRQVTGSRGGPGQGCLMRGEAEIVTEGEVVRQVKEKFSWARGALVIKVKEVQVQL